MSDLFNVRNKTEQNTAWRGTLEIEKEGEIEELSYRQLTDPEFFDVMTMIDMGEVEDMDDNLDAELVEEYDEAIEAGDEDRAAEIEEQFDVSEMFAALSSETYKGLMQCAKLGVEPDADDVAFAQREFHEELAERYGTPVSDEQTREWVNENIIPQMIDDTTDFSSLTIGVTVLTESIGDEGN